MKKSATGECCIFEVLYMSDFNFELAMELHNSSNDFPVNFGGEGWQWLGYAKKQNAKEILVKNFIEGIDYRITPCRETREDGSFSHCYEKIETTVECFKYIAMMAGTEKGKEVRKYFLECEKIAKEKSKGIALKEQDVETIFASLLDKYLAPKLDKIEKYEKACEEHDGAGYVINSNVSKKTYPSEAVYAYEYCALKKLDNRYWRTFSRRYAQFVRVGTNQSPPKRNGKLFIYGELYYYAEMALANVMEII